MPETRNKPDVDVVLITALLGSFRSVEVFIAGAALLGAASFALGASVVMKLLAAAVFASGVAALYYALRIRIDHRLFAYWDDIDPAELDARLQKLNRQFQPGRSMESRIAGARTLFQRGIILAVVQCTALIALAWACAK